MGEEATADFERYVAARRQSLVRAAVLIGVDVAEAEDAVQRVLLECYRQWSRVRRADDVDAYVFVMLRHGIARQMRRGWRRREVPVQAVPETAVTYLADDALALRSALLRLPMRDREVLVARYYLDLSVRSTARTLSVSEGTVKSRTSRALARLQDVMDHPGGSRLDTTTRSER